MKDFRREIIKINGWKIPVDVPTKTMSDEEFIKKMSSVVKSIKKK